MATCRWSAGTIDRACGRRQLVIRRGTCDLGMRCASASPAHRLTSPIARSVESLVRRRVGGHIGRVRVLADASSAVGSPGSHAVILVLGRVHADHGRCKVTVAGKKGEGGRNGNKRRMKNDNTGQRFGLWNCSSCGLSFGFAGLQRPLNDSPFSHATRLAVSEAA